MLFTDISSKRAINVFLKLGFLVLREGKHTIMGKNNTIITIPRHKRLNPYTLKSIIKDAGISDKQFKELL